MNTAIGLQTASLYDMQNQIFKHRYFVPQNLRNPIFWTTVLCDILNCGESLSIEFKLVDYNNNTGIEYEMLRRVLASCNVEVQDCLAEKPQCINLIDAKILLSIGIITGAGMDIMWRSGVNLFLFDEILEIFVPESLNQPIQELLMKDFGIAEDS